MSILFQYLSLVKYTEKYKLGYKLIHFLEINYIQISESITTNIKYENIKYNEKNVVTEPAVPE